MQAEIDKGRASIVILTNIETEAVKGPVKQTMPPKNVKKNSQSTPVDNKIDRKQATKEGSEGKPKEGSGDERWDKGNILGGAPEVNTLPGQDDLKPAEPETLEIFQEGKGTVGEPTAKTKIGMQSVEETAKLAAEEAAKTGKSEGAIKTEPAPEPAPDAPVGVTAPQQESPGDDMFAALRADEEAEGKETVTAEANTEE
jgi:hypothetical protein